MACYNFTKLTFSFEWTAFMMTLSYSYILPFWRMYLFIDHLPYNALLIHMLNWLRENSHFGPRFCSSLSHWSLIYVKMQNSPWLCSLLVILVPDSAARCHFGPWLCSPLVILIPAVRKNTNWFQSQGLFCVFP
jgi:hypothetical protein